MEPLQVRLNAWLQMQPETQALTAAIRAGQPKKEILRLAAVALVPAPEARGMIRLRVSAARLAAGGQAAEYPRLEKQMQDLKKRIAELERKIDLATSDLESRRLRSEHTDATTDLDVLSREFAGAYNAASCIKAALTAGVWLEQEAVTA